MQSGSVHLKHFRQERKKQKLIRNPVSMGLETGNPDQPSVDFDDSSVSSFHSVESSDHDDKSRVLGQVHM